MEVGRLAVEGNQCLPRTVLPRNVAKLYEKGQTEQKLVEEDVNET